ncbi:MAG: protease SohB [Candidatus Cloacimonetes bacterium 4572_55]|nr:MAG: protease SohB [Candidatus Cloacimonetes bacterium 4572_55]
MSTNVFSNFRKKTFLAKVLTVLTAILFLMGVIGIAIAISARGKLKLAKAPIKITNVNDRYQAYKATLKRQILSKKAFKKWEKSLKKEKKSADAANDTRKKRVYSLNFKGDLHAREVDSLREEITAILSVATEGDEVVIHLESPGGSVVGYGLAASQLERIRARNIRLTVSVDKIAASGGYKMACVADHLVTAPFAMIGSIGVVMGLPNFHRLLKKKDIDYELLTAGEYKRTLTLFGENTNAARQKDQEKLEDFHTLFKDHIASYRPQVDIDRVGNGDYWAAKRALEMGLVDELITSDDLLLSMNETADIYEVRYNPPKKIIEKLSESSSELIKDAVLSLWETIRTSWY